MIVVWPLTFWVTTPDGWTSTSNRFQTPLGPAGFVELMQCVVTNWPFITTLVPGEHILLLKRSCPGAWPRIWASTETGKLSPTAMPFGSSPKIITPEFAMAHAGVSAG